LAAVELFIVNCFHLKIALNLAMLLQDNQISLDKDSPNRTIALLHWGDRFEDFFDTVGISFEDFRTNFTGGWLFNYIDALKGENVSTVIYYFSARVHEPLRFIHVATGSKVCILPVSRLYKFVRYMADTTPFPGLYTLASYLATPLRSLAAELRHDKCNAILCQEYEYARFDLCVFLGKGINIPVFASFQGGSERLSILELLPRILAVHSCSGLIIGPKTQILQVQQTYSISSSKIAQIFNPMDVANWHAIDRSEARAALNISLDAKVVVYHGRIEIQRKGLDVLLKAWEELCKERPHQDLRLLLVGTGTDAKEFGNQIDAMKLRGVMWINKYVRDRKAILQYLSAADVYTLPSRHEGFPVAPIEAMATGLPVVAADAPGVSDILDGGEVSGGIVVPREDKLALASALGRVLDDPVWSHELGQRARQRAENYFSLEVIGKQLRQFIFQE
jgi:starch synthase